MNKADNSTPQRTIRVEDDLWRDARVVANERDENVSDVIRRALKRYVKRYEGALSADQEKPTATYVRRLSQDEITGHSDVGDQTLWKVTPPVESWDDEEVHSYVVVSHNESFYSTGPETMVFPARANGQITSFGDLQPGNGRGLTVMQALAGYEIHKDGYKAMKYPKRAEPEPVDYGPIEDANGVPLKVGDHVGHYHDDAPGDVGIVVEIDPNDPERRGWSVNVRWIYDSETTHWHTPSAVRILPEGHPFPESLTEA